VFACDLQDALFILVCKWKQRYSKEDNDV